YPQRAKVAKSRRCSSSLSVVWLPPGSVTKNSKVAAISHPYAGGQPSLHLGSAIDHRQDESIT
ncbi:jg4671, partial [Pararge aegeria aegeria]